VVKKIKISIFVAHQVCACLNDGQDCCAAPGQSEKEINGLTEAIKKYSTGMEIEIKEIREVNNIEKFPQVTRLFKNYGYNALPIILVGDKVVAYGIPDKEFIVDTIKNSGKK